MAETDKRAAERELEELATEIFNKLEYMREDAEIGEITDKIINGLEVCVQSLKNGRDNYFYSLDYGTLRNNLCTLTNALRAHRCRRIGLAMREDEAE